MFSSIAQRVHASAIAAISESVQQLSPASAFPPLFFAANHNRITELQGRLATLEAEIEEKRDRRNAAARRLISLGGKARPRPPTSGNTVAFPVFRKAEAP